MECEYEFAIPVDCGALDKLMNTPCSGYMGPAGVSFQTIPTQVPPETYIHRKLLRKATPIIACKGYYSTNVHWFLAPRKAATYYFIKCLLGVMEQHADDVRKVWYPKVGKYECFFLGKYPVFWGMKYQSWLYAHTVNEGMYYPFGHMGFIPGIDMGIFRDVSPDRWSLYISADNIIIYKRQTLFWNNWIEYHRACVAKNYPSERPLKPRWVKMPYGYMPWQGEPMSKLKPPSPDSPRPPTEAQIGRAHV